jgi:hypothetical protein
MQTPARFRKYAEECRHLAKLLSGEQKDALLKIASAWDECAANAEQSRDGNNGPAPGRPKPR